MFRLSSTNRRMASGHGNFLPWIDAEFGMSADTAERYMKVATEFGGNSAPVRNLNFKALIALSYAPTEVREQVEGRASKGEKVTAAEIEKLSARVHASSPIRCRFLWHKMRGERLRTCCEPYVNRWWPQLRPGCPVSQPFYRLIRTSP